MINFLSYHNIIMVVVIVGALTAILIMQNLRYWRRVRKDGKQNDELSQIIKQVLSIDDFIMADYDAATDLMTNTHGHPLPDQGVTMQQFMSCLHPNDQPTIQQEFEKLLNDKNSISEVKMQLNEGSPDAPDWQLIYGYAMGKTDPYGKVTGITLALSNLTKKMKQESQDKEWANKYQQIFENQLMAMSLYDKDGHLIDMNTKMQRLCGVNEAAERFFYDTRLSDVPVFKDFDFTSHDDFHVCQHMDYPDLGVDEYIEYKIHPVFDSKDELTFYSITVNNLTHEREIYLSQTAQERQKKKAAKELSDYEHRLQYLLESNKMYVFSTNVKTRTIEFSRSIKKADFLLDFDTYVSILDDEFKEAAKKVITSEGWGKEPFYIVRHFKMTPADPQPAWYIISGTPTFDEQGNYSGVFGVIRNINELKAVEEQLKEETFRAERSGKQKSAFLANMTHEIRTPLNAIVGFSDLLQYVDEDSERQEFLRIILNNCDMQLRLINDILEVSSSENEQLSIEPEEVDFALVFNDICQTLAQRVDVPGVEFIKENPYERLPVTVDKGRIQQVYTNFVTNAVKYTREGHIKVGYQVRDGGLYMYCEDTGTGIPKDKQAAVFDRFVKLNDFVQGTGLGLNICRSIAKRCGGKIGVKSDGEGQGSTFWFWIPI